MLVAIDVDGYYEWEAAPGAKPSEDELLALEYKPAANGNFLRRVLVEHATHTAININEAEILQAEVAAAHRGRTLNRALFVANYIAEHVMPHHAPPSHFSKVLVHDDAATEALVHSMLVPTKRPPPSGAGSSSAPRARPFHRIDPAMFEGCHSHFHVEVRDAEGLVRRPGKYRHNLTTDTASGYTNRRDWQAKAMGGGLGAFFGATAAGAATATSSTSLTNSGASFPTSSQGLAGMIVACGPNSSGTGSTVFGVILSNTATVLTVDQWYNPATGAAGTTPNATCTYQIIPGQFPAMFMAVTGNVYTPAASDTTLAGEATTNGFSRAIGTWAHTAAATTYTQTHQWNATGPLTITNECIAAAATALNGAMPFESAETSPPVLISGDQVTETVTITIN
jgi:hypothetical protein